MDERVSSLHDDFLVPFTYRGRCDCDPEESISPEKMQITERSYLFRTAQFGITKEELQASNPTSVFEMTDAQYSALLCPALSRQYELAFASVFAYWEEMTPATQWQFIESSCNTYRNWGFNLIGKGDQLSEDVMSIVVALEGADCVHSFADAERLYKAGIRSVMLQYNKPNHLTTDEGLTPLGERVVRYFLKKNVILDLAHSSPGVRKDIFALAKEAGKGDFVIYSHGSLYEDIARDKEYPKDLAKIRGLSRTEAKQIIKNGGIVGLCVSRPFFQSLQHVAERINWLVVQCDDCSHIALGTDFGGFGRHLSLGINGPGELSHLTHILKKTYGYSDAAVERITRTNARNWLLGKK